MRQVLYPYRKWIFAGLVLQVIAAWFSVGFHFPDEHFLVFEYCNYKLGFSSSSILPWEFAAKCRSGVLPFFAFCLSKILLFLHLYNPVWVAFLLRLIMGLLTWLLTCRLVVQFLPEFSTNKGKLVFIWCSFLLWFIPYLAVRFTAENIAAFCFFLSISLILTISSEATKQKNLKLILAGLLFGLAVFVRLQMVFAIAGVGVWLLVQKWLWKRWVLLFIGGAIGIGLCVMMDYWFYGEWLFTPWIYYKVNIIQQAAAKFGVFPWWYYFQYFFQSAVPPLSIVLMFFFFKGMLKKPLHILTIVCICFLAGHILIGHKEMRFLFPVAFAFIFLASIGIDNWAEEIFRKKVYRVFGYLLISMNGLLMLYRIIMPANEAMKYYIFIYNYLKSKPAQVVSLNYDMYILDEQQVNFYKPDRSRLHVFNSTQQLDSLLTQDDRSDILYFSNNINEKKLFNHDLKRIYCLYPNWLLKFNSNNWEERSNIWAVYKVER